MTARALVFAVAACAACRNTGRDAPGTCLPSPGAGRTNLIADPAGGALYWLEDLRERDYEGDVHRYTRLVRFDLRGHRRELVADDMTGPVAFVGNRLVGRRYAGRTALAVLARDGLFQLLTPEAWTVYDFEPVDDHTVAMLADGDGPRAVYTLDLDEPRPKHIIDADTLLTVSNGRVFVVADSQGVSVDLETGARDSFTPTKHYIPLGSDELELEDGQVRAHSMVDGSVRTIPLPHGEWRLGYFAGMVLARTVIQHDRSDAVLLTRRGMTPLPTMLGGTAIFEVAELNGERWALVGHNTSRYAGDLGDVLSESDVCLLPESGALTLPTREVPLRYVASAPALFAAAARVSPGSELQVFDGYRGPLTVALGVGEDGASNFAGMRARARDVNRVVTSILRDREMRTDVSFHDRRRAVYRWRRKWLAPRTLVGMGDALLQDVSEVGLELRDGSVTADDKQIRCSGTLVNTQKTKVEGLKIECGAADPDHAITVPSLEPNGSYHFQKSYDDDIHTAQLDVLRDNESVPFVDASQEATVRALFDLATGVFDRTGLALSEHKIDYALITVTLRSDPDFETSKPSLRERLAHDAYTAYAKLRTLYNQDAKTTLTLRIEVDGRPTSYEYDGTTLKTND